MKFKPKALTIALFIFCNFIASAQSLLEKGAKEISSRNYDKAIVHLSEYIRTSGLNTESSLRDSAFQLRAYAYWRRGLLDSAKKDYRELISLTNRKNQDKNGEIYYLIAKLSRDNSQFDSCLSYAEKALSISLKNKDSLLLAKSNLALGLGYYSKSMFEKANDYWLEAMRIGELKKDSMTATEASFYIGLLNTEAGSQNESLKILALTVNKFIHNDQYIEACTAIMSMGICHKRLKQYDSTLYYYRKALDMADTLHDMRLIARINHNLSDVFQFIHEFDSALHYNNKALGIFKSIQSEMGIIVSQNSRGQLFRMLGETKKDKSYFLKAISLFEDDLIRSRKIMLRDFTAKCYEQLALCYANLGNYDKAYDYIQNYHLLNDSIRSEKIERQMSDLQVKYETEKKDNEILKLNSEKTLDVLKISRQKTLNYSLVTIAGVILILGFFIFRNVQKKRSAEKQIAILEKQNAIENMRSKFASDVHDDMGANLTRIGLYSQQLLHERSLNEKEKQMLEKISLQSKNVIAGMKEIIWTSNPAHDNLRSMLGFMRQYIDRFLDGTEIKAIVNFPNDPSDVMLHPEVRRNLFLILKESLNNALKYSGTDRIDIDFRNEGNSYNFSVKDYGKGMSEKKDEFSNGIKNMQSRAEQINSVYKMTTSTGEGVKITVEGMLY